MTKPFEIGPIRPPSEADSLLLRVTRNCPWNKCKFCKLYKGQRFTARAVAEIKADIDQIAAYRDDIRDWTSATHDPDGHDPSRNAALLYKKLGSMPAETAERYLYIQRWLALGRGTVFFQDANTMVLTYSKLREILEHLREKLPEVKRVTSYGRVDSLSKFTVDELTALKTAGLDRIHSGYESGSDKVLALLNKGYTKAQEIEAGQRVKASGIELSIYYMPGAGGRELSDDNADETADVVNKVNPDFVRIRTFVSLPGTELINDINEGRMTECTDIGKMRELRRMIAAIDNADGHLFNDHIINLFENVNGNMKTDKNKMLSIFAEFENLTPQEQRQYQLARRTATIRTLPDYPRLPASQREKINELNEYLDTEEEFEKFLLKRLRHYV